MATEATAQSDWQSEGGGFYVKYARVVTIAEMFMHLVEKCTAADIYSVYCSLTLLAVSSEHSWASPARQAAAVLRRHDTNRYGWR